jgi:outer membrane protein assembly factor BamD
MRSPRSWSRKALPAFPQPVGLIAAILAVSLLGGCASDLLSDDPAKQTAEGLYADAKLDLANGAYEKAIKTLERVEARAGGTLLAQQALLDSAWASWKSGERAQAIATIDRFIKLHPSSVALDYALYLKGLIDFNDSLGFLNVISRQNPAERDQQAARDSYQAFRQLVDQFPDSKYSADARLRMDYIVNALAEYEVHVARYYFKRGAYVAAANRAQQAVREYPQAPANEEALYILTVSYERLGMNELHDDALRVLNANFPGSAFVEHGIRGVDRPWWIFW